MATLKELEAALVKADAAGNTEDAQILATEIRRMRAQTAAPAARPVAGPPADPKIQAQRQQWAQGGAGERAAMLFRNFLPYSKEPAKRMAGAVVDAGLEGGGPGLASFVISCSLSDQGVPRAAAPKEATR